MTSHASTPGTATLGSSASTASAALLWRASSSSAAVARLSAERSTPAPRVMIRWIVDRASGAISGDGGRWSAGFGGARAGPLLDDVSRDALGEDEALQEELDASRFAPCTPVQATSPQAYRPGTVVRPRRSVRMPPEA